LVEPARPASGDHEGRTSQRSNIALFHSARLLVLNGVVVAAASTIAVLRLAANGDLAAAAAAFWLICYPNFSVPLIIWGMTQAMATYVQRAEQDPLTGLLNRRAFAESVETAWPTPPPRTPISR
jgi:diguanylate cyclase